MSDQEFSVMAPGRWAALVPALVGVLAPMALLVMMAFGNPNRETWIALLALSLFYPLVAGIMFWSFHRRGLVLREKVLKIRGPFWPRNIEYRDLDIGAARLVDLDRETALRPLVRLLGTRVPGFRSGWFRLRDRRRAYVVLSDWRKTVLLPRRNGSLLMFSLERPEAFLDALRRRA